MLKNLLFKPAYRPDKFDFDFINVSKTYYFAIAINNLLEI